MTELDTPRRLQAGAAHAGALALRRRGQLARRARLAALAALALLLAGAGAAWMARAAQTEAAARDSAVAGRRYVRTVHPAAAAGGQSMLLPGTLEGQIQTPIVARGTGYLLRWTHDIGSAVQQGELLAEIDTPEVDRQLEQALAARGQVASIVAMAHISAQRAETLRRDSAVSQQELDERRANLSQSQARLDAADADIGRLRELQGFKRVLAPFTGVITQRNVNVGELVGNASAPLFVLTRIDRLRLYVQVPQAQAQQVRAGMPVQVTQAELPGLSITGQVLRTAGAIDARTGTMRAEITLPNADRSLLPGAYVQVALPLAAAAALRLPANALLFRPAGTMVALLGANARVRLRTVALGRDFGAEVEIVHGLSAADTVILNPGETLADNDVVTATPVVAVPAAP